MSDFFERDDIVKDYDAAIMRRIFSYIKKYKLLVACAVFALAVSTLGELAVPLAQKKIIDDLILPAYNQTIDRAAALDAISAAALALFAILFLVFAAAFVQTWTSSLIGQRVMEDIRLELFRKTLFQSTAFLSRHPVGRIVTRLTGDVETINEFFTTVIMALLKDVSIMAGVIVTLVALSPALSCVMIICLPLVLFVSAISRARARDAFRRQRVASSAVNAYLAERITGMAVVQLFRGEAKSRADYNAHNSELLDANLGEMFVLATFRPIVEFLAILMTAAVIVAGSNMLLHLELSL